MRVPIVLYHWSKNWKETTVNVCFTDVGIAYKFQAALLYVIYSFLSIFSCLSRSVLPCLIDGNT